MWLILLFGGCEDDPSSVGKDLLDTQDLTNIYTFETRNAAFKESYIDVVSLGAAGRTLIGKYENTTSTGLMKFYFSVADSIEHAVGVDSINLISAYIKFRPTYYMGDKSLPWSFTAHKITNSWGSTDFTRDSLKNVVYETGDIGSNLQFVNDSTITFDIDINVAYEWMLYSLDDETHSNNGVILIPTTETSRVIGFPALTSVVTEANLPQLHLIVEKPGHFVDTVSAIITNDAYAVEGILPNQIANRTVLQGGLPVRTNLMFDVSQLSKSAVIIDAGLSIYIDSLNSQLGSKGTDSLVVSFLQNYEDNTLDDDDNNVFNFVLTRDGNKFTGNIRRYVQHWIDDKENQGFQVKVSDETSALTKYYLYDQTIPDESFKPLLQIIYTDVQ
jgi:hypothetical protein